MKLIDELGVWAKQTDENVKRCPRTQDPPAREADYVERIERLEEAMRKFQTKKGKGARAS